MNGRGVIGLGTAGLLVWALGLAAAVSAHPGAVAVTGSQEVATGGACPGATFVMSGDLEGCWTTETFDIVAAGPNGIVIGRGIETFVGCIGSQCGTVSFTFTFIGKFDAGGAELWGGCHHPITGGTGDFAGATGALRFVDVPDGSSLPPAGYTGQIVWRG